MLFNDKFLAAPVALYLSAWPTDSPTDGAMILNSKPAIQTISNHKISQFDQISQF